MMSFPACVVLVTCGTLEEAEHLAETIVNERLAACVNVIAAGAPVRSFYIWKGSLQKDGEYLLVIKTVPEKLDLLEKRIQSLHSYTVPEFIALPVIGGSAAYLSWLEESVEQSPCSLENIKE